MSLVHYVFLQCRPTHVPTHMCIHACTYMCAHMSDLSMYGDVCVGVHVFTWVDLCA